MDESHNLRHPDTQRCKVVQTFLSTGRRCCFLKCLDGRRKAYVLVGGKHQFFPKRQLQTIAYSIEDTYQGLYQQLRGYLGKSRKGKPAKAAAGDLTYARYGLWHCVRTEKQKKEPSVGLQRAGANLRVLMRVLYLRPARSERRDGTARPGIRR